MQFNTQNVRICTISWMAVNQSTSIYVQFYECKIEIISTDLIPNAWYMESESEKLEKSKLCECVSVCCFFDLRMENENRKCNRMTQI